MPSASRTLCSLTLYLNYTEKYICIVYFVYIYIYSLRRCSNCPSQVVVGPSHNENPRPRACSETLRRSKVSPEHRFISSEASLCEAAAPWVATKKQRADHDCSRCPPQDSQNCTMLAQYCKEFPARLQPKNPPPQAALSLTVSYMHSLDPPGPCKSRSLAEFPFGAKIKIKEPWFRGSLEDQGVQFVCFCGWFG